MDGNRSLHDFHLRSEYVVILSNYDNKFNTLHHISRILCHGFRFKLIMLKKSLIILLSLSASVLFIWSVGYLFCNSIIYYQYDQKIKKFIHAPGTVYKYRSEGFGSTYKGLYGINAIRDISLDNRDKVVVWGDSYVEAHQVDDKYKIPQLVTTKLQLKVNNNEIICFGVGMSADSVADYYFDIPKYEKITKNIRAHFLIITDIRETLPDQLSDTKRGLFRSNPYTLYQDNWSPEFQTVKKVLGKFRLYFVWDPIKSAIASIKKLNFLPTIRQDIRHAANSRDVKYTDGFLADSWGFLFERLSKQTNIPIVIIYCPIIPIIENGKISYIDKYYEHYPLFKTIVEGYGIHVLDATPAFVRLFEVSGKFPRGFNNSKPSRGHFNVNGHEIVSEIIYSYIVNEIGI